MQDLIFPPSSSSLVRERVGLGCRSAAGTCCSVWAAGCSSPRLRRGTACVALGGSLPVRGLSHYLRPLSSRPGLLGGAVWCGLVWGGADGSRTGPSPYPLCLRRRAAGPAWSLALRGLDCCRGGVGRPPALPESKATGRPWYRIPCSGVGAGAAVVSDGHLQLPLPYLLRQWVQVRGSATAACACLGAMQIMQMRWESLPEVVAPHDAGHGRETGTLSFFTLVPLVGEVPEAISELKREEG